MYWDRLDIVEAYYLYFCHYHEGQGSLKYQRLSNMGNYFTPRLSLGGFWDLSDNGQEIYLALEAKTFQGFSDLKKEKHSRFPFYPETWQAAADDYELSEDVI